MKNYILLSAFSILSIACNNDDKDSKPKHPSLQEKYTINEIGVYPEGIDYDSKNEKFLYGSMYKGTVYSLSPKGEVKSFATSSKLVLPTGLFTDEVRNRLIVANADLGISQKSTEGSAGSVATVAIFNLDTGALIKEIDLKNFTPGAGSCPNDIAVDSNGIIYVTDSFSPVIYKIDNNYTASVFLNNALFEPAAGAFGLNGIVFHPDGYLLAAKSDTAKIFKIPLSNPQNSTEVTGMQFASPDGLELDKDNNLVVVENGLGLGKSYTFKSTDNWASASKVSETNIGKDEFPTTAALASDGNVYVINSKLGKLLGGDQSQSTFVIQKIK
ncbi:SMP-30/gluconolactonase/LRE family protein [Flavobacterium sp. ENC]|uniref:SMP-30/gluconolactonase/LRE family protein n=1 Tax=Flavobacterium sp. ENC TaxID=2897330 RepID=UPI001E2A271C|nr:SMP-30/gluconolactonase/LRE family protein [Flavobacterium sp. ENC]MCD0467012.1 SMP-30/gluconolactonase/LRE family protein [Flavobacterium sp. ENC]